jgi:hypothetical protein
MLHDHLEGTIGGTNSCLAQASNNTKESSGFGRGASRAAAAAGNSNINNKPSGKQPFEMSRTQEQRQHQAVSRDELNYLLHTAYSQLSTSY